MATNITTSCYEDIWAALEALNFTVPVSAFEEFLERYKRECRELREKILEERALLKEIEEQKENIDVGMEKGKGKAIETAPSKPVKTPRPPNSYFIYRSCFVREVAKQKMKERLQEQKFKLGDGKCFAKVASLGWGALKNAGQVQQWVNAARVVDTAHKHIFPEYKYKPGEKKETVAAEEGSESKGKSNAVDGQEEEKEEKDMEKKVEVEEVEETKKADKGERSSRQTLRSCKRKADTSEHLPIARRRRKVEVVTESIASSPSATIEGPILSVVDFLPGLYFQDEAATALGFVPVDSIVTMPDVDYESDIDNRFKDIGFLVFD